MTQKQLYEKLEQKPIIAAVRETGFSDALTSPSKVIFMLGGSLLTIESQIAEAHKNGKLIFVHLDLAEGIGKDKTGVKFLANCGADGIISTRASIIRTAKDQGLLTVQRFFALDSQGVESITEVLSACKPDLIEIMPGVIGKIIQKFSEGDIPIIAGGLIETGLEAATALKLGAFAVSTGKAELWNL